MPVTTVSMTKSAGSGPCPLSAHGQRARVRAPRALRSPEVTLPLSSRRHALCHVSTQRPRGSCHVHLVGTIRGGQRHGDRVAVCLTVADDATETEHRAYSHMSTI